MKRNSKITPFHIDDEELKDPKMDAMLKRSVSEEADEIEKDINSDRFLRRVEAPDDLFENIKAQLKAEGVWEEEEEKADSVSADTDDAKIDIVKINNINVNSVNVDDEHNSDGNKEGHKGIEKESDLRGQTAESRTVEIKNAEGTGQQAEERSTEDIYNLLSKEDREALELGKKVKRRRKKTWKQMAAAAAVVLVVFGVGIQGEASRRWMLDIWDKLTLATGMRTATDYVEDGERNIFHSSEEEQKAWMEIKEKLESPIIGFGYVPDGMEFKDYSIISDNREAFVFYSCDGNIFNIKILTGTMKTSTYLQSDNELLMKEEVKNRRDIPIKIWDTTTNGVESYMAECEFRECTFIFSGAIPFEEFEKIIKFAEII